MPTILKDRLENLKKWEKDTKNHIVELENTYNPKRRSESGSELKDELKKENVNYLYMVTASDNTKEFHYCKDIDEVKEKLNDPAGTMEVGNDPQQMANGATIKRMGLDEMVKELEEKYREQKEKLNDDIKNSYKEVSGVDINLASSSNGDLPRLYAYEVNGRVYVTTKSELKADDLRTLRNQCCSCALQELSAEKKAQWEYYVIQDDIKTLQDEEAAKAKKSEQKEEAEQAPESTVKHNIGLDKAYQELKKLVEKNKPTQDPAGERKQGVDEKQNVEGKPKTNEDPKIGEIKRDHEEIFGEKLENTRGYMLKIVDGNAGGELGKILGIGDNEEKFFTADQLAKLAKEHGGKSGLSELYNKLTEMKSDGKLNDQGIEIERLGLEKTHEKMVEAMNKDIMELYNIGDPKDRYFYAYEVVDMSDTLKDSESKNTIRLVAARTTEEFKLQGAFKAVGDENLKNIKVGETIRYANGKGDYIEYKRVATKEALDQEKRLVDEVGES